MPNHYFRNGNGDLIPVTLEACVRGLPGSYHAIRKDNEELITFHRDCLVTKFTPEEIAAQEVKRINSLIEEARRLEINNAS